MLTGGGAEKSNLLNLQNGLQYLQDRVAKENERRSREVKTGHRMKKEN